MYTFETKGGDARSLRPEGTAVGAARGAGANLHKARAAGEALVLRPVLPLRARRRPAATGTSPGRRSRRSAPRTRRWTPRLITSPTRRTARWACATSASCSTRSATRSAARSTARRCRSSCAAWTWTRTPGARVEINPLRVLDDKRPEVQAAARRRPAAASTTCATPARPTTSRSASCSTDRASRARTTRSWCAASTTTRAPPSSSSTTRSARSPRVGGGGRYDGLSEDIGGPALPGDRLGARRRPHGAGAGGRGASRSTARTTVEVFARAARRGGPAPALRRGHRAAPGRGRRRHVLRRQGAQGRDEGRRPVRRGVRGRSPASAISPTGAAQLKDLETGEQTAVPLDRIAEVLKERLG